MKIFTSTSKIIGLLFLLNSCSNSYYTKDDFYRIKKIDTHVHLNSENIALAEQAIADNFALLAVNVDVPSYPPLDKQFDYSNIQKKQFPTKIENLTAFTLENWNSPNWAKETISKLKTDFAKGALGIKIWKNIGMTYKDSVDHFIMIDNPKFDSVIEYIIQNDKTVMGHLGEPKNCWLPVEKMTVNNDKNYFKNHPEYHMFLHPDYPSYETQIKARDNFVERHPNMRFVGAHL
ncbi:MAG: hydrolase, partial [Bacteroidota bacterium]